MSYAETRRIIDVDSHVIELDDFLINAARPDERAFDDGGVLGEPQSRQPLAGGAESGRTLGSPNEVDVPIALLDGHLARWSEDGRRAVGAAGIVARRTARAVARTQIVHAHKRKLVALSESLESIFESITQKLLSFPDLAAFTQQRRVVRIETGEKPKPDNDTRLQSTKWMVGVGDAEYFQDSGMDVVEEESQEVDPDGEAVDRLRTYLDTQASTVVTDDRLTQMLNLVVQKYSSHGSLDDFVNEPEAYVPNDDGGDMYT